MKKRAIPAARLTDKAAIIIAQIIMQVQKRFCRALNRLTRNFSAITWKVLMVIFALSWGILCVRCVAGAFKGKVIKMPNPALQVTIRNNHSDSLLLMEHVYELRKK